MLGLPPGSFGGRFGEYLRHVHPEDAARARQVYVDCLKGRTPEYRTEDRVVWPDGSVHWLETYGRASYARNGRARQLTGVIKDITPRKQIARAHDQAEQLISRVFEASPDYISITRQSDGRILAVNPAFERVTGFRAREVVGRTVQDVGFWVSPSERCVP
jgi:PAS domain-containing protein